MPTSLCGCERLRMLALQATACNGRRSLMQMLTGTDTQTNGVLCSQVPDV